MNGLLIVLDGTDGSGKATQTKELLKRLRIEGWAVETMDFPQYDSFFGTLIGECLAGKHGDFAALDPKIASVLYAADRFIASKKIKAWLEQGRIVILDRYVSSNQIHQGGKIHNDEERKEFLLWLDKMEHKELGIPRPNLIIYLDVPIEVTLKLLKQKSADAKKSYKTDGKDVHEDDVDHLTAAKESGLKLIAETANWYRVQCYDAGHNMLPVIDIHNQIWDILLPLLKSLPHLEKYNNLGNNE